MFALLGIFASSFVIALSGALMPGPLLTATISESTDKGFVAGPLMILGHGILELALVLALLLGLAPILNQDSVFGVVALAGAVILLWMAYGMFRSLSNFQLQLDQKNPVKGNLVVSGILMSLANPYWTIWWATIGLGYILHSQSFGIKGILFFFCGHILADLAWYSLVSFGIAKSRSFLSVQVHKGIIAFCACFLVVFAGYFGYSGYYKVFEL